MSRSEYSVRAYDQSKVEFGAAARPFGAPPGTSNAEITNIRQNKHLYYCVLQNRNYSVASAL